jgi:SAM-dependent methyltransferase
MKFNSFRRHYLDRHLIASIPLYRGKVLDIGGVKINRRGEFRIPVEKENDWTCLNQSKASGAEILASVPPVPVPDESYDTVLMSEVLEYIEDAPALLKEVHRLLRPEGTLIMSVPFIHPLHGDPQYDCWRFTETGIRKLIAPHFTVEKFATLGGFWAVTLDLILNLAKQDLTLWNRFRIKLIGLLHPLFLTLDRVHPSVNTGFFLVLKKK